MTDEATAPAWHQALVYALTGERRPELGVQPTPDVDVVATLVAAGSRRAFPVPADLMQGIGAAQFWAVVTELRRRLAQETAQPVLSDRPPGPDDRRLLSDVPPHHG